MDISKLFDYDQAVERVHGKKPRTLVGQPAASTPPTTQDQPTKLSPEDQLVQQLREEFDRVVQHWNLLPISVRRLVLNIVKRYLPPRMP